MCVKVEGFLPVFFLLKVLTSNLWQMGGRSWNHDLGALSIFGTTSWMVQCKDGTCIYFLGFEVDFLILGSTLPETKSSHLKMDGWNLEHDCFLLGHCLFSGANCSFQGVYLCPMSLKAGKEQRLPGPFSNEVVREGPMMWQINVSSRLLLSFHIWKGTVARENVQQILMNFV